MIVYIIANIGNEQFIYLGNDFTMGQSLGFYLFER